MSETTALKKSLGSIHIWALAVGLVISGEYFGWNYGWASGGPMGMFIATLIITVFYLCFVFSYTELTTAIPDAGGPFTFADKAFGRRVAVFTGYATVVEFVLATPAIAIALGSYIHFLHPMLDITVVALCAYALFTIINLIGIKESAAFTLIVTILAIVELLVYIGITSTHYDSKNIELINTSTTFNDVFSAIPFAIWLYLAIEGVAMVSEEVEDPKKSLPIGYISGIITLCILAIGVMFFTCAAVPWQQLTSIDYPLPETIGILLGKGNSLTMLIAGVGVFGLIASFNSIITSYSRQIFALSRADILPKSLAHIHERYKTPDLALLAGLGIGVISIFSGKTNDLIILSAMGATSMYIISLISLFALRKKNPLLNRPFLVPYYPIIPMIALVLGVVCLIAMFYFNIKLGCIFFVGGLIIIGLHEITIQRKKNV
ncbi:MAG: ethanolamine permease [Bacteroidota bacterium]|jgi:ethanolamine permease